MDKKNILDSISENVNICSSPSGLKITDIRVTNINGAPKHCPLIKIYTNQGIIGYGENRDASSATYALMLKSRLVGENPCNVDKLFRRIKQNIHEKYPGQWEPTTQWDKEWSNDREWS